MTGRAVPAGLIVAAAALAFIVLPPPAGASWPHDPNVNVPLCTATDAQTNPTAIPDGEGGAIVAWQDYRGGYWDIYAQRVSAAGVPLWTADGVVLCTASGNQTSPKIVSDGAGGAIVMWLDSRYGEVSSYPYAQRVNAAGTPQWTADGVQLCPSGSVYGPSLVSDGAGGAIVTWHDNRSGNANIYVQRVSAAGTLQWTALGVALCTAAGDQGYPAIVSDGAGGALVTWHDNRSGNADIYAQRVNAAGTPQWTYDGVVLSNATSEQFYTAAVSDGAGGAIVTWYDFRNGNYDIYAHRVNAAGTTLWFYNGVALCTATGTQQSPALVPDGTGGAIVTWHDYRGGNWDIYAQRVNAAGTPQWTTDGVSLCTAGGAQMQPVIAADDGGGAIATWMDYRGSSYDIYAQRVNGAGAPQWTANGVALCTAGGDQWYPAIASDGAGGAIVTWYDLRSGTSSDIYAQRIERFGYLGNPEPDIISVRDVPNDQGGFVQVEWTASYLDAFPAFAVTEYSVWRRVPNGPAPPVSGAAIPPGSGMNERRERLTTIEGVEAVYWEYLVSLPARGLPGYSYVAPTTSDSLPGSNPRTSFMVMAEQSGGIPFWMSDPDSGHSVDNLAPPAPAPFTGQYAGGTATLHWGRSTAPDFAEFRLYRGVTRDFTPGPGNLIVTQPDTGYVDAAGAPGYYKLSAVDLHGNEGPYAFLQPEGTVDAPGGPLPRELALSAPAPNPLRGSTTLRLTLPRAAQVSLAVFDQQGRRVRGLIEGVLPAGDHALVWDGRDGGGRPVASALYFVRLKAEGHTLTRRVAAMR